MQNKICVQVLFLNGPNFLAHNAPKIEKECHFKCILDFSDFAQLHTSKSKINVFGRKHGHFCKKKNEYSIFTKFLHHICGILLQPTVRSFIEERRRGLVSFISSSSSNPAVKPNVMKRRTQTAHYVLVRRYRRGFH